MKNFKSSFISTQSSLRQVITVIDQSAAQIALVVDAEQKLIGTVTDGDIRRGLLRGETLESPAERVMHREFRFVREGVEEQAVLDLMSREVLHQIPMLDSQGRVVRLFLLEDLLKQKTLPNKVVIMAGGEGKRLRPLTKNCPKPMLPVQGKPMLEILLEQCKTAGLRQFYFAVNYLKQKIIDHFADGSRWGVDIHYLKETHPLGTTGALVLVGDHDFLRACTVFGLYRQKDHSLGEVPGVDDAFLAVRGGDRNMIQAASPDVHQPDR